MLFPPCPQNVELKFRYPPYLFHFTELEKNFFLENSSNYKITLIKTKGIVIIYIMVTTMVVTIIIVSKA